MSTNYTLERDLNELEAMVKPLDEYVRRDTLYGSVSGGFFSFNKMPALTVGAVMMRLRRLDALHDDLNEAQRQRLDIAKARNTAVFDEWRTHYTGKMQREAESRLDAMRTFFEECGSNPNLCPRIYMPEASRRTIVQEILITMNEVNIEPDEDLDKKIKGTDGRLRGFVKTSDFIWASQLEAAYPRNTFWWLYHQPVAPGK